MSGYNQSNYSTTITFISQVEKFSPNDQKVKVKYSLLAHFSTTEKFWSKVET